MDEYNTMNTVLDTLWERLLKLERHTTEPINSVSVSLLQIHQMLNGLLKLALLISIADPVKRDQEYLDCHLVCNIDTNQYLPKEKINLFIRLGMMHAKLYSLQKQL